MIYCKFLTKSGEVLHRNYKWKERREIEAIARKNKWVLVLLKEEQGDWWHF